MTSLLWLSRGSGWLALMLLCLTLCVSPLAHLARSISPHHAVRGPALRRLLGIASGSAALVHAGLGSVVLDDGSLRFLWATAHVRAGSIALIILSALLVTSFPALVRALHLRLWKELHRLAYVALFFTAQHALSSPFAPRTWLLAALGTTVAVGLLRALPARGATRPPQDTQQD